MSHLPVSTLCTYGLPLRAYDRLALEARSDDRPGRAPRAAPPPPGPRRRGLLRRVGPARLAAGTR